MRLLGFINVFNLNPSFLQPVFWSDKLKKAYFQHSENTMTISTFEQADLDFYIDNAKFIVYPEKDIIVQAGSTVIFAICIDKHIFLGDFLDIKEIVQISIENKEEFSDFPGFYNTCVQFLDAYKNKCLPDIELSKQLQHRVIRSLSNFCSYVDTDRTDFVDLYFRNKRVPKFWTISIVKDLVFSLARIRKSEEYICSLLSDYWGLDISQQLTPFREELDALPELEYFDVDSFLSDIINSYNAKDLYIVDFLKTKLGHILIAENYFTNVKSFISTKICGEEVIYRLFSEFANELLRNSDKKLYLVINSFKIIENTRCNKFFSANSDKIQILELPTGYKLEKRI